MQKPNKTKIVLTGGHAATAAMAVVEELLRRSQKSEMEIYWIGVEKAVEGSNVKTLESELFPKMGVNFKPITMGRIQRRFTIWTIPSLLKIPFGFISALFLLLKIKPKVILSFGGAVAYPVVVCGWLLGIPIVIHEQTTMIGRANRFSAIFAKKIAIARESSKKYVNANKCVLTGNSVMTQITEVEPKTSIPEKPTLFIMGGSRGSQTINENIEPIIEKLRLKYNVIHQTGSIDFPRFSKYADEYYKVYDRIDPMKLDNVYREADLILSRAGANTVSEIIITGRPAVLIPIPWTYMNEQYENAKYAEGLGIATILPQKGLTPEKILDAIDERRNNWNKINKKIDSPDRKASAKIVDLLESVYK
jgi:UDP-N-acetylglucosamine--N-acetylmuramyl-(pentapeptide) pyrophosphoryl-undecaprenol N-acetylglucosamine transferase